MRQSKQPGAQKKRYDLDFDPNKAFGKPQNIEQDAVKRLFYEEPQETRKDLPQPGEQKRRYKDLELNPQSAFGRPTFQSVQAAAAGQLQQQDIRCVFDHHRGIGTEERGYPETKIVPRGQDDQRRFNEYEVGKPKNHGQYNASYTDILPAGAPKKGQQLTAAECLFPKEVSRQELEADKDLGKARPAVRAPLATYIDQNQVFGRPTFKTGKPASSVAQVFQPLPQQHDDAHDGVGAEEEKEQQQRARGTPAARPASAKYTPSKEEVSGAMAQRKEPKALRATLATIGQTFDDRTFDTVFKRAVQIDGGGAQTASILSFIAALKQVQGIK